MSRGLERLEYLKRNKRRHWLDGDKSTACLNTIEEELKEGKMWKGQYEILKKELADLHENTLRINFENAKKLQAFEIIKKYPQCSLQRYIGFNEMVKDGYELTQKHLFNHDMPCSVEEFKIVIEVLL